MTQSPNPVYVSAVKKSVKKEPLDVELANVAERLKRIEKSKEGIYSILDYTPQSCYDEFVASIPKMVDPAVTASCLDQYEEDDTPKTMCIWKGLMYMEGNQRGSRSSTPTQRSPYSDRGPRPAGGSPAHCDVWVVVKSRQMDTAVNASIALLPPEFNIEFRIGWDNTSNKHMELLNEDAVVFMVRSSCDVDDEGAATRRITGKDSSGEPFSISPIDSQKALLGMLQNLRDKQRIGVCRYTKRDTGDKCVALCVPPSANAFARLGVPWRFRDMTGHDTILVVVGKCG